MTYKHKLWFGVSVRDGLPTLIADTLCGHKWNPKDGAPCRLCQRQARRREVVRHDKHAVYTRTLYRPLEPLAVH